MKPTPALLIAALLVLTMPALPSAAPPASMSRGEALFTGAVRFANGGPPCGTCHSVSGLGLANGGSLGPDLTGSYALLGDAGMDAALATLFFPTMMPIFGRRLLTPEEQQELKAFLQGSASRAPPGNPTGWIALIGVGGCVGLLFLAGALGRRRLRGVRRALVAGTSRGGALP